MASTGEKVFLFTAVAGIAGYLLLRDKPQVFSTSEFFRPDSMLDIVAEFPEDEDQFIIACWRYASTHIEYEPVGSDMLFFGDQVECLECFTPMQALLRGKGNCVAKSSLLASLLSVRLNPSRVRIVIGDVRVGGIGGHAWVEVLRNGQWYLLEATAPPRGWITPAQLADTYIPYAVITEDSFTCDNPELCVHLAGCQCEQTLDEIAQRVLT